MDNTRYEYWPLIHRPRLELPNGARLAFWIGYNIEHFEVDKPSTSIFDGTAMLQPDPLNFGWRDYGARVGVWRMMDLLSRHNIRASVTLNSDVCARYPQIIEEGNKLDWIWLAHGKNNSIFQTGMSPEDERAYLTDVITTIKDSTGKQPRGWLGPALTETFNTPDILAELGVDYVLDWCNDDQPYPMKVKQGRMISVPYSIEVNDIPMFVSKGYTGEQFYQAVVDQFDQLYAEGAQTGRVMGLALHPFVINQPFRHKYLARALEYITGHDDVWLTTSDEIAEWYYREYYDSVTQ
ncbi:polysaccharide deacetylase family protein [Kibdelosporangium aridum]|uniref:polysaccharide deacetylase family protein n=1 Tax=Kibdelosporangium aridum TaxID=2030 RepID=UPI000524D072